MTETSSFILFEIGGKGAGSVWLGGASSTDGGQSAGTGSKTYGPPAQTGRLRAILPTNTKEAPTHCRQCTASQPQNSQLTDGSSLATILITEIFGIYCLYVKKFCPNSPVRQGEPQASCRANGESPTASPSADAQIYVAGCPSPPGKGQGKGARRHGTPTNILT